MTRLDEMHPCFEGFLHDLVNGHKIVPKSWFSESTGHSDLTGQTLKITDFRLLTGRPVKELVQLLAKVVGWNGKSPLHFQNFNLIYLHNHSVNFAQISRDHKRPRIFLKSHVGFLKIPAGFFKILKKRYNNFCGRDLGRSSFVSRTNVYFEGVVTTWNQR